MAGAKNPASGFGMHTSWKEKCVTGDDSMS